MGEGQIVAGRFEVLERAGSGSSATVFRARDHVTGLEVALKVLSPNHQNIDRFLREGRVLAELRHPAIVRYVDHGTTERGDRFLAMEWLAGEDLGARLGRAGLSPQESLLLITRVAAALAEAHGRGIVHRDVKPSNLFLVDGLVETVTLIDFGVARTTNRGPESEARVGTLVGTPAYMSPEQARGAVEVEAGSDVYSLGTVLFQCLTGRKPFVAQDPVSLLAKIILQPAPRVRDLRAEIPEAVDDFVARLLAKDPAARPRDGAAVVDELRRLPDLLGLSPSVAKKSVAITTGERRFLCLVVASRVRADVDDAALRLAAETMGGKLESLYQGSLVVSVSATGAVTDLARCAARCALLLRTLLPGAPMALTGGLVDQRLAASEIIERASRLLYATQKELRTEVAMPAVSLSTGAHGPGGPTSQGPRATSRPPAAELGVRIDDDIAGLLDGDFALQREDGVAYLRGPREVQGARTLLGKPTPFVSREAEIGTLEAVLDVVMREHVAHAVLITATAGTGKSRLRHELVRRLESRGAPVEVWLGRCDPMSAGTSFGPLMSALRRVMDLREGEPLPILQQKVRARVGRDLADTYKERVVAFVGELLGVPFADDGPSVVAAQLRAARRDAIVMGDQMLRAWEDWLRAECTIRPVLLVLEDFHWGDLPTARFVSSALRNLHDCALMVLALARPDVHERFPELWSDRGVQEIRLGDLSRKACERLVREVLGERTAPVLIQRLVDRAAGNAFYLEELIRAASAGQSEVLPESVIAMVQARLESLEPSARHVLRAASVFGQVFWEGGVRALLGGDGGGLGAEDARAWLDTLVAQEALTRRTTSELANEREYVFRHALVREAAYAMLPDRDRALGHKLAAAWLVKLGHKDVLALAEHYERARDPASAIGWWKQAAAQALSGNDLTGAVARAERGVRAGARGAVLGQLRLLQSEAERWRGAFAESFVAARDALRLLPKGTEAWFAAAEHGGVAGRGLGKPDEITEIVRVLQEEREERDRRDGATGPGGPEAKALVCLAGAALLVGVGADAVRPLFDRVEAAVPWLREEDPVAAAHVISGLALRDYYAGDPGLLYDLPKLTVPVFERTGDLRAACQDRGLAGFACVELGAYGRAEEALRDVVAVSDRMGLLNIAFTARQNLGLALHRLGKLEDAAAAQAAAAAHFSSVGNRRMEGASLSYLAAVTLAAGDPDAAEAHARRALRIACDSPPLPLNEAEALSFLARIRLVQQRWDEAQTAAARADALVEASGGIDGGEALIRLVHAEALAAAGAAAAARAVVARAAQRVRDRAAKIADPELRASFLENVEENRRTLRLADSHTVVV